MMLNAVQESNTAMPRVPRKLSLVKWDGSRLPPSLRRKYPFRLGAIYIFLGEIPNMPGHCVVADHSSGRIYSGHHTDHFVELASAET
jgi:hypothetical protein